MVEGIKTQIYRTPTEYRTFLVPPSWQLHNFQQALISYATNKPAVFVPQRKMFAYGIGFLPTYKN